MHFQSRCSCTILRRMSEFMNNGTCVCLDFCFRRGHLREEAVEEEQERKQEEAATLDRIREM